MRGRAHAAGLPIALVLGTPGAPLRWPNGCVSYVDPRGLIVPLPIPAPVQRDWSGVLAIPSNVTMTGLRFVLQTFQLDPFVTGQFDSSNAVVLTLGT